MPWLFQAQKRLFDSKIFLSSGVRWTASHWDEEENGGRSEVQTLQSLHEEGRTWPDDVRPRGRPRRLLSAVPSLRLQCFLRRAQVALLRASVAFIVGLFLRKTRAPGVVRECHSDVAFFAAARLQENRFVNVPKRSCEASLVPPLDWVVDTKPVFGTFVFLQRSACGARSGFIKPFHLIPSLLLFLFLTLPLSVMVRMTNKTGRSFSSAVLKLYGLLKTFCITCDLPTLLRVFTKGEYPNLPLDPRERTLSFGFNNKFALLNWHGTFSDLW